MICAALLIPIASADRVDDQIRAMAANAKIPGAVLAVAKGGRIVRVSTYGLADVELKSPVRRDTVFEIGSVSKQFTCAVVLRLAEQGKLKLTDTVGQHLPDAPDKWKPLTLRQILSHTAGLKDTMKSLDDPKFKAEDYFKTLGNLEFDFAPGTSWSYSNMGFNLAAAVVEKVTGKSFPVALDELVLKPLQLTHTRMADPQVVVPGRAKGYAWTGKGWRNYSATYPATALGAGALISTVDDLARWDWALQNGTFLKPESMAYFVHPTPLNDGTTVPYGLGWFVHRDNGREFWEHGGNTMAFSCSNMVVPFERTSIIFLTNLAQFPATVVTRTVAANLLPSLNYKQRPLQPDPAPDAMLRLIVNLRALGRNERNTSAFSPKMQGTLSSLRGAMMRGNLGGMVKDLRTFRHIESETLPDGNRLSRYAFLFGKENRVRYMEITWTKDNLVEDISGVYAE